MRKRRILVLDLVLVITTSQAYAATASGPLRIHPTNPRYFTDGSGKAVFLTGSHTWANLQDIGLTDPPPAFDFPAYLDFLERHRHNFIRLWRWEFPRWTERGKQRPFYCVPQPWQRTGPSEALDGKARFDLQKFDVRIFPAPANPRPNRRGARYLCLDHAFRGLGPALCAGGMESPSLSSRQQRDPDRR
jgi:hypothetical protein